jgi:hypothetical protein
MNKAYNSVPDNITATAKVKPGFARFIKPEGHGHARMDRPTTI